MTKWTAPDIASIRGDNSRPLQKIFGSLTEYLKQSLNEANEISQTYVRNGEATALTVGTVVYLDGQQGDRATVKRAFNTSDATSAKTLGVVAELIPVGGDGLVTTMGYLEKVDTSAFTAGATLYLGATAGTMTTTKPYAPNHLVYVGVVVRANAGNGIIYVRCQNGYELDEIHDVQITSPAAGDLIMRNVSNLWINTPQTSITSVGTLTAGTVPASLLSGTTLPASIVSSSLTSVGTLSSGSIPATLLTGTVASARLSGSYTGITGLGTLSSSLSINLGALGTTSGNTLTHFSRIATTTNTDTLDTRLIRGANGSDWSSAYWRIGRLVDSSRMGFIQFGDTGGSQDVKFGIGTTIYGVVNTSGFSGAGSQLTSLNASNLSSGTVASARISGSYTGFTSITVDGPSSAAFSLGDWGPNGNYGGVIGNKGYLLIGNNAGDDPIYLRTSTAGAVNIGANGSNTLSVGNNTSTFAGNLFVTSEVYSTSNVRISTAGANFVAQNPTTSAGNAAQWLNVFGVFILIRNTSTRNDKENIQPLNNIVTPSMIDDIDISLWNRKNAEGFPEIGPMAEDMDDISPFLSIRGMDCDDEGNVVATEPSGINQNSWLSLLTLGIQDLRKRVEELEKS